MIELEIYIHDCPADLVITWLQPFIGPVTGRENAGDRIVYRSHACTFVLGTVEDGFISVWIHGDVMPWQTDVQFARAAARDLERIVRCDPGPDNPEVPALSGSFLQIDGICETLVNADG